ncbi:hypothetical protein tb265_09980 [Gemmatimonadetes bacterium T265]|nr:hypothetical protein tb265_09980 [Gemmatimonadetes bacterium T265]
MDCSEFRRHHLAYVDDTLPGDVLVAAERHRVECAACGAHDTLVRRSLLLARNLPTIEPSADFAARLEARLRDVRTESRGETHAEGRTAWSLARRMDAGWSEARHYEARWYERLAQDAGGWGRQAVAAAVVLAAVSAGYAIRGGRDVTPAAVGPNASTVGAADAPARDAPARDTPFGGRVFGGPAFAGAMPAATEVAATPAQSVARPPAVAGATHPARSRAAERLAADRQTGSRFADVRDTDDLGAPVYIPLPAGALEAAALLGPTSAGIPVWPAALLAGEAPSQLRTAAPGAPSVRLVGLSH